VTCEANADEAGIDASPVTTMSRGRHGGIILIE